MIRRLVPAALLLLVLGTGGRGLAHDLPNQITVQAFLKADQDRTEMLVRVPLVLLQGAGLPERAPGLIDLEAAAERFDVAAVAVADQLRLEAGGTPVTPERYAHRVSLPTERTFESFETAREHVLGPALPDSANVVWNQGFFDVYFAYPALAGADDPVLDVALGAGFGELLRLVLRYLPAEGEPRAYRVHGDHGALRLDPGFWHAASTFTRSGIEHILSGIDHLLFLLCLILPFRLAEFRTLLLIVTAFTVAHSVTLIAAALGAVPTGDWFPPLVEVVIAASIVYMAVENLWVAWAGGRIARLLRFRWLITGAFGLIHGFGFAFVLSDQLQFAGRHLLTSLLAFNLGVELGQIAVLLVALPLLELIRRTETARRMVLVLGSVLLGHTAWHWMTERYAALELVEWPALDGGVVRALAAVTLIALGVVLLALMWRTGRRHAAEPGAD